MGRQHYSRFKTLLVTPVLLIGGGEGPGWLWGARCCCLPGSQVHWAAEGTTAIHMGFI